MERLADDGADRGEGKVDDDQKPLEAVAADHTAPPAQRPHALANDDERCQGQREQRAEVELVGEIGLVDEAVGADHLERVERHQHRQCVDDVLEESRVARTTARLVDGGEAGRDLPRDEPHGKVIFRGHEDLVVTGRGGW